MKIARMQVNHITNPLGYDLGDRPVFSWVVQDTSAKAASASRVQISCKGEVVADTGWTALDAKACPIGLACAPRTRYEWRVSVRDERGKEATSDVAWFETAKLDEPWEAVWVSCDYAEPRHPVFTRCLHLARDDVATARMYVCGLGLYEATIDGQKIGDEYLAPGTHDYDLWLQYQSYDVTDVMRDGAELAIALGHGWYSGRFGYVRSRQGYYGRDWRLICEVRITYKDGSEQVIGTDSSWQVLRTNTVFSNIYDGERTNDMLPQVAPVTADVLSEDEATSATARLHARLSPPVTAHEKITPTLIRTPANECVLDLGQEITGTFRLRGLWPKGTVVRVQTAELLQDGNFYRANLRTALSEFVYRSDGRAHVLQPRFTFYGYRYAKITIDGETPERFCASDFTGIVLHSDFDYMRARIRCDHPKVMRLVENARWSMRDNFLDTPTDCPQRDERMGWTGDANVFSRTALLMGAPYAFYRKYLHDMALEQEGFGGGVPTVVPNYGFGPAPAVWADATTHIPWNMWQMEGDASILAEHFDAMCAYVDWAQALDARDHALARSAQYGDWMALDGSDPTGRHGATDEGFIAYVYLWQSARIVAKSAKVLGRRKEQMRYEAMAEHILAWLKHRYLTPTGRPVATTMTSYVLCLTYDLGNRGFCAKKLRRLLKDTGGHLVTGFVGTPLLCPALSEAGLDAEAYTLLLNEDYPSWLFAVNLGATTIWERWDALDAEGRVNGDRLCSMNHYCYGSIVEWIITYAAGIQAQSPGFSRARIAPRPNWDLHTLDTTLDSAAGTWRVLWECVDERRLHVRITVPFDTTAEVILPHAPASAYKALGGHVLTSGTYEVTYDTTRSLRLKPNVKTDV